MTERVPLVCLPHWLNAKSSKLDTLYYPLSLYSAVLSNAAFRDVYCIDACAISTELGETLTPISFIGVLQLKTPDIDIVVDSYVHMSSNHLEFERNCLLRMFYLRNLMRMIDVDMVIAVESDVLVYQNLEPMVKNFCDFTDAALTDKKCPATALLTLKYVEHFCECVIKAYTSPSILSSMSDIFLANFKKTGKKGGICDMTFNQWIGKNVYDWGNGVKIRDSSSVFIDGETFVVSDNRISKLNHGSFSFRHCDSLLCTARTKKIFFQDGKAYLALNSGEANVRLLSGHYQGGSKTLMGSHYLSFFA